MTDVSRESLFHPDPMRAHGAWAYLFAAVASGALVGGNPRVEVSMLVGTGFAGAFLVAAALAVGWKRKSRQALLGLSLAVVAPMVALALGANSDFLSIAIVALLMAATTIVLERAWGALARTTLVTGVATLTLAAPIVAVAGGASIERGVALFLALWLFYSWRTLSVAASLVRNTQANSSKKATAWDRDKLKKRGLREAAVAAVWALIVIFPIRLV